MTCIRFQVNLFLRIIRRRPDGYHDLASLFHVSRLGLFLQSRSQWFAVYRHHTSRIYVIGWDFAGCDIKQSWCAGDRSRWWHALRGAVRWQRGHTWMQHGRCSDRQIQPGLEGTLCLFCLSPCLIAEADTWQEFCIQAQGLQLLLCYSEGRTWAMQNKLQPLSVMVRDET